MKNMYMAILMTLIHFSLLAEDESMSVKAGMSTYMDVLVRSQDLKSGYNEPGGEGGRFGSRTVVQGDVAFVSAPEVSQHGVVYILGLDKNGRWQNQGLIEPSDGNEFDRFGDNISIHGNTLAITAGNQRYEDQNTCLGAVYLYKEVAGSWVFQQKINSPDTCMAFSPSKGFARSVYLSENQLFIGQITDNDELEASGAVLVYNKTGSTWAYSSKVKASEPILAGIFGTSISVYNDWMLVGARAVDGTIGLGANGNAYFFHFEEGQWVQKQIFSGNENNSGQDLYGHEVYLSGARAFVAVPGDDVGIRRSTGSVRVFELDKNTWKEVDQLTVGSPNPQGFDRFGFSLDVLGDYVLVGSLDNGAAEANSGAAYLYLYTDGGLQETQRFVANDFDNQMDDFSNDVALHSDYVMVGKSADDDEGFEAGSIYSFKRDVEQQIPQKLSQDGVAFDAFGTTIEIEGNMAFVGAVGSDENKQINSGVVYVFEYDGLSWNKHSELLPAEPQYAQAFGSSVSVSGNTLLVGAPVQTLLGSNPSNTELGSVYVFEYDGSHWVQVDQLKPDINDPQIHFGSQVSLESDRAIIGAAKTGLEIGFFETNSSVFYFERINDEWVKKQHILTPHSKDEILFGRKLELIGGELLLSAEYDDSSFKLGGAVYVYELIDDNWVFNYRIVPDNHQEQSLFGSSFSKHENMLLVSSPNSGQVHFFEKTDGNWSQTQHIASNEQYYSHNILLTESHAFITCQRMDVTRICTYENVNGSWQEQNENELTLPEIKTGVTDFTMNMFNNQLLVGIISDDTEGKDAGIVFGYKFVNDLIFSNSFE